MGFWVDLKYAISKMFSNSPVLLWSKFLVKVHVSNIQVEKFLRKVLLTYIVSTTRDFFAKSIVNLYPEYDLRIFANYC